MVHLHTYQIKLSNVALPHTVTPLSSSIHYKQLKYFTVLKMSTDAILRDNHSLCWKVICETGKF